MKTAKATEFKTKCRHSSDKVQRTGGDIVIPKRGKTVARVVAGKESKPWLALRGTGAYTADPFAPVLKECEIETLK